MASRPPETRSFRVHARSVDAHHGRIVHEPSFEAAAVAYLEDLHEVGGDDEMKVIVRDIETGHEHCFTVDLGTGETQPCG